MFRLYTYIFWGVAFFLTIYLVVFFGKWLMEAIFPRKESYLDDPAPSSVVWQNRNGITPDEEYRDQYRSIFNKTSTRVVVSRASTFSLGAFGGLIIGFAMFFAAVIGMVLFMQYVLQ